MMVVPDADRSDLPPAAGVNDREVQAAVLRFLLQQHPAHISTAELRGEMSQPSGPLYTDDEIERAVRDLVRVGLLHQHVAFVFPTRAAVHQDELPN